MEPSIEEKFVLLKSLCKSFSTKAKAIGGGFSSLVVDMGDETVSKYYIPNWFGREKNKEQLLNEVRALKALNGRAHDFRTPVLIDDPVIFEDDSPIAEHFIGYIPMTKLDGHTIDWDNLSQSVVSRHSADYLHEVGSLIASIHDTAMKTSLGLPNESMPKLVPVQIPMKWMTDPELVQMATLCNAWFARHQQTGFVHADLCGRNIMLDKDNHVSGILDFTFSGIFSNHMRDFYNIAADQLPLAIKGYEGASGRAVNRTLIEMTQIQNLGCHIPAIIGVAGKEKELEQYKDDFAKWVRSITKDLALQ